MTSLASADKKNSKFPKKQLFLVFMFFIILELNLFFMSALDCPRGLVDDAYPGVCGLYIDSDDDSICDYSQELSAEKVSLDTSKLQEKKGNSYYFLQISVFLIIIYLISLFLSKRNVISNVFHKRLWNFFLLISFLGVGISGVLLVLKVEFGINLPLFNWLFWHVETGIAMTLISIFHIIWHWKYFRSYLKKS